MPVERRIELDHVVIAVSQWERSNAFCSDLLGAELVEIDRGRWAYRFGDRQLNVHGPGTEAEPVACEPVRPGNSDLCFAWGGSAESAIRAPARARRRSELGPVTRLGGRGKGLSVYFRDPDGSLLELIAYG